MYVVVPVENLIYAAERLDLGAGGDCDQQCCRASGKERSRCRPETRRCGWEDAFLPSSLRTRQGELTRDTVGSNADDKSQTLSTSLSSLIPPKSPLSSCRESSLMRTGLSRVGTSPSYEELFSASECIVPMDPPSATSKLSISSTSERLDLQCETFSETCSFTVSQSVDFSFRSCFSEVLCITMKVEAADFEKAVSWIRDLVSGCIFTKDR